MKLGEIASIQMGYSFRTRLEVVEGGSLAVIQMKDLGEVSVDLQGLCRIADDDGMKEHHLARPGDLIFRSRGLSATAVVLATDPGPAVVAAPLLRIRILPRLNRQVLPDYLAWAINQPPAQAFLASMAKGTAQKMICKQTLESLEVPIPPPARQRFIIELATLAARELELVQQIAVRRRLCLSKTLMQLAETEGN